VSRIVIDWRMVIGVANPGDAEHQPSSIQMSSNFRWIEARQVSSATIVISRALQLLRIS
jgi:hypothetical protein